MIDSADGMINQRSNLLGLVAFFFHKAYHHPSCIHHLCLSRSSENGILRNLCQFGHDLDDLAEIFILSHCRTCLTRHRIAKEKPHRSDVTESCCSLPFKLQMHSGRYSELPYIQIIQHLPVDSYIFLQHSFIFKIYRNR